ncbi:MAG: hypothetical protein LBR83_09955 [Clostridiales bacterium]|nr:hypothetical protein [Clostridiales bacterium]
MPDTLMSKQCIGQYLFGIDLCGMLGKFFPKPLSVEGVNRPQLESGFAVC